MKSSFITNKCKAKIVVHEAAGASATVGLPLFVQELTVLKTMALRHFNIIEHVVPGQHVREYPHATRTRQEDILHISVKEYVPKNASIQTKHPGITIIATHGNGFPKETYEPLWDDMYESSVARGLGIRGIWFADSSNQGASGVKNEHVQGDDTNWFDHSRDLLLMINHFRQRMVRPIVGFAHSMGCAQLVNLSIIHPRLLSTLILIEPIMMRAALTGPHVALVSTLKRDIWPSRTEAEASFRNSKAFKNWDPRAVDKFVEFTLRPVPTALYPAGAAPAGAVTLTTTKHQEAWSYLRPNFEARGDPQADRLLSPDMDPEHEGQYLSHRAEAVITLKNLPHLRPSVLYMFGSRSPYSQTDSVEEKTRLTGSGVGGSGGAQAGKVKKSMLDGVGHMVPFQAPAECAERSADWLAEVMERWQEEEEFYRRLGSRKSERGGLQVSRLFKDTVKRPGDEKRPVREKL